MHSMETDIQKYITDFFKKNRAPLYYVAVSGGLDSMSLLWLLKENKLPLHVLHVNYNLRGKESTQDSKLVSDFCIKNKIPFTIHSIQLKEYLEKNGGNLQQEARIVRYAFFNAMLNNIKNSKLVLAQHFDDQMETFWLQLLRNSGMAGLSGMREKKENYLRPFLKYPKEVIQNLATKNSISWREDSSNAKNDYARNRWRNEYLPFLQKTIPSLSASVNLMQEVFQKQLNTDSKDLEKWKEEILKTSKITLEKINKTPVYQTVELFKKLEIPLAHLPSILELINTQKGSSRSWKTSNSPFNCVVREAESLVFYHSDSLEIKVPKVKIKAVKVIPTTFDKRTFYLNPDKIKGEIYLRKWKIGDRIHALGLKGSKLISDVLTHAKVPNSVRKQQFVLVDQEKIIACPGYCVDRRSISKSGDKLIIRVELE